MYLSKRFFVGTVGLLLITLASLASAATVYNVNRAIGAGSVVGTITTDGSTGVLGSSNITNWSLTLTDNSGSFFLNGTGNSAVSVSGSAFSATATDLSFNFNAGSGYVLFQNPSIGSGNNFWCIDNGGCINSFVPGETVRTSSANGQVGTLRSGSQIITSTSPVPIPAAAWLFGSALLGFVGLSRRRKS